MKTSVPLQRRGQRGTLVPLKPRFPYDPSSNRRVLNKYQQKILKFIKNENLGSLTKEGS